MQAGDSYTTCLVQIRQGMQNPCRNSVSAMIQEAVLAFVLLIIDHPPIGEASQGPGWAQPCCAIWGHA
eukprot:scaffold76342_cov15-Tisochrysis_lutea.AAC.1